MCQLCRFITDEAGASSSASPVAGHGGGNWWSRENLAVAIVPGFEYTAMSPPVRLLLDVLASDSFGSAATTEAGEEKGISTPRQCGDDSGPQSSTTPPAAMGRPKKLVQLRRRFLQFVTGSPALPPGGLRNLRPRITVDRASSSSAAASTGAAFNLPTARTCSSSLRLPPYETKEELERMLLIAIEHNTTFQLS